MIRIAAAGLGLWLAAVAIRPAEGATRLTSAAAPSDTSVTTVFLVRHAEKNTMVLGSDPPLSGAGTRRAAALAHALRDAGITAIYSTAFRRCRDTAGPLAALTGDTLRIVDQGDFAAFARRVVEENRGGRVLVVGHGDTVPQILEQWTGTPAPPFTDGEHDRLYVVTLPRAGPARALLLRYGEPAPAKP